MILTNKTLLAILTAAILILLPAQNSLAQTDSQDDQANNVISIKDLVDPVDDEYIPVTMETLSQLYWAIGKLDLTDDQAIDDYMLLNECELFTQFYHDDIEWKKLHDATREYISQNMSKFPTRFELIVPITLDRYDVETQKFTVALESQITNAKRLDVRTVAKQRGKQGGTSCRKGSDVIGKYNDSMVLVLNQPFTFVEFEVPPELADMYLEEAKSYYENLPPRLQISRYERLAYLRLKYRVTTYKEEIRDLSGSIKAVVLGRIDGYEVYADPDKYKPLFKKEIKSRRRLRKRRAPRPAPVKPAEEAPSAHSKVDFSE